MLDSLAGRKDVTVPAHETSDTLNMHVGFPCWIPMLDSHVGIERMVSVEGYFFHIIMLDFHKKTQFFANFVDRNHYEVLAVSS